MNFIESWYFLEEHPIFNDCFQSCLDVMVVKVNPGTNMVEDEARLNTKTQVWLECGPFTDPIRTHDPALDCGGSTFEEAVCRLAELVKKSYGPSSHNWRTYLRMYTGD